ncbi:response regulator transcription factor [Sphingomicrobium aestuariivivum]|uniref:response regulator transcription factor n=1 Tax=Sphingomicrobium aestuariivivum TaxID=1582356 RepID=UPI001FD6ADC0|nr:response regulator transcription factor [Sphingomicrobium aestuariivivum]MCJ8190696.1 response regulator transcription factor [Sphingomicrobium aestuariivivum]
MARIILADDDKLVTYLVRSLLEEQGHLVGSLPDGRDVAAVLAAKDPDLLILDCAMPEKTGTEVLRELRAAGLVPRIPVLMLTSRASAMDRNIAYEAGASDYLAKPFDPDELVVRVEALLTPRPRRAIA